MIGKVGRGLFRSENTYEMWINIPRQSHSGHETHFLRPAKTDNFAFEINDVNAWQEEIVPVSLLPFYYIRYYFRMNFKTRAFRLEQHRRFLSQRFEEIS